MALSQESLERAVTGALDFIDGFGRLYSLPASMEWLTAYSGIEPVPVSSLSVSTGFNRERIISSIGSRDGVSLLQGKKKWILYDDSKPVNRVRFTICEELMHYKLGHVYDSRFNPLVQDYSEEVYEMYEEEAKLAACLILCPPSLYLRRGIETRQLMRTCGVSEACAYRIRDVYRKNDALIRRLAAGRPQLNIIYTPR